MSEIATYAEFQALPSSEKVSLVTIEASFRSLGWSVYSGSVYSVACSYQVISQIEQDGTALVAAASIGAITAGKYFLDRAAATLYLQASDSSNPNSKFIAVTVKLFFSNIPKRVPNDLSTGFDVEWLPYVLSTSEFGVELDNQNQLGLAIEGSGSVKIANDKSFWSERYDKLAFENHRVLVYSWSGSLPIAQAKLIYRGRIQSKNWSISEISFELSDTINELRSPISLPLVSALSGARLPTSLTNAVQRLVYGRISGHVGTNYDQTLTTGYPLGGTVVLLTGATSIAGTGTTFLAQLSPGDQVRFGTGTAFFTIATVTSNTAATISSAFSEASVSGATAYVKPKEPKRWQNRKFSLAGHAISQPETTVASATNVSQFDLASTAGIRINDYLYIESQYTKVTRLYNNTVRVSPGLATNPTPGSSVTRLAVFDVYLDDVPLTFVRDYIYTTSTGELLLDSLAAFNVAQILVGAGTVSMAASRIVTGVGTTFKKDLKASDWIAQSGSATYYEILSVESDTSLTLRTVPAVVAGVAWVYKTPKYYVEGTSKLTVSMVGATVNGVSTGVPIETGPQAVTDLLTRAGLSSVLVSSTFTEAAALAEDVIGVAFPSKFNNNTTPIHRDAIGTINKSILGALIQNEDFQLEYQILSPERDSLESTKLTILDVIGFSVQSDANKVIKDVRVNYLSKEFDPLALEESGQFEIAISDYGNYLAGSGKRYEVSTALVNQQSAINYAYRLAAIFGAGANILRVKSGVQLSRLQVGDRVELSHEFLFERVGSLDKRHIGMVRSMKQTASGAAIETDDLSNSFDKVATITENTLSDFGSATSDELAYNGFITDTYGMMNNDEDTYGPNSIW